MVRVCFVRGRIPHPQGPEISKEVEERNQNPRWAKWMSILIRVLKFTFHYGFIPLIIYLGYTKGADPGLPKFTPLAMVGLDFLAGPDSDEDSNIPRE